jgi:hypothetical protein
MLVLMVELLCQAVMDWIPALKLLCFVLFGIKWPCCLRIPTLGSLARY